MDSTASQLFFDEGALGAFLDGGETLSRTYTVSDTSKETIIALAWTDPAGVGSYFTTLTNNLNLSVLVNGCTTYVGNRMVDDVSQAIPCGSPMPVIDYRNNVELIVIPPATSGTFTVTISTEEFLPTAGSQSFAMYIWNGQ